MSPETAAATAPTGVITDPRDLDMPCRRIADPEQPMLNQQMLVPPLPNRRARSATLEKGPNIPSLPILDALPDRLELPVIAEFTFDMIDQSYFRRAKELRDTSGHAVVCGHNYGQGSSREHAELAPRFLGLRVELARGFARDPAQKLVHFGILPLEFVDPSDYDQIESGDMLVIENLGEKIRQDRMSIENRNRGRTFEARHHLSACQKDVLLAGGAINWVRNRL